MLTQIIMSLADATQPAFSTIVMMIKCCNCAQLHSYFQLILSMPCSRKLQILSNSICAEAPVVIRLVVGWPKLGNFLHHMDQFRVPHPVRYPYLLQGIPFPHATGSPPNPQRDQCCCTSKCSFPSMLWYAEFGSVFFKSQACFFLGRVAEPVFVPVMYLNMIKHAVFTNVTCSLVFHSSCLWLCTISGICICICTYDLAMWVWQSQLCIVNSFLMWVQSQTRSFSGKRPAAAALQLPISLYSQQRCSLQLQKQRRLYTVSSNLVLLVIQKYCYSSTL